MGAEARGWGAGWPNCQGNQQQRVTAGGVTVNVRREIARLVEYALRETAKTGYVLKQAQTGAFVCRPIGGTRTPSNHSWGLAIDLNWQENPFTTNAAAPRTITPAVVGIWKSVGFSWGGDWSGKKDFMHMEFNGSPADAARRTAALTKPVPPKPPEVHPVTRSPRVDIAWTPSGFGYYVLFADGGVANYGDARPGMSANGAQPSTTKAVALAVHPSGGGVAILWEDGQIDTRSAPNFGEPNL